MTARPFRFEPLLNLAEQREEQQTLALAAVTAEERAARDALAALERERERAYAQFAASDGPLDAEQHLAVVAYAGRLTREIEEQQAVLAEVGERVARERDALMEVVRERRSFEHLRDQDEAVAAQEEGRREASAVDDLNMARHARGARSARAAGDGMDR